MLPNNQIGKVEITFYSGYFFSENYKKVKIEYVYPKRMGK